MCIKFYNHRNRVFQFFYFKKFKEFYCNTTNENGTNSAQDICFKNKRGECVREKIKREIDQDSLKERDITDRR